MGIFKTSCYREVLLLQGDCSWRFHYIVNFWKILIKNLSLTYLADLGHVAQSVGHLTCKSGVLGSIPGLATYFRFSFRCFKKGSCQLLAKVCARSTG